VLIRCEAPRTCAALARGARSGGRRDTPSDTQRREDHRRNGGTHVTHRAPVDHPATGSEPHRLTNLPGSTSAARPAFTNSVSATSTTPTRNVPHVSDTSRRGGSTALASGGQKPHSEMTGKLRSDRRADRLTFRNDGSRVRLTLSHESRRVRGRSGTDERHRERERKTTSRHRSRNAHG